MKGRSVFDHSVHAEVDLLNKVGDKAKGSKIYIYRFNNTTSPYAREPKNGKPCPFCQHALKKAGVSRVYHVDDSVNLCTIKNRELQYLIGEPATITRHFLKRYGDDEHQGKFTVMQFLAG